MHTHVLQERKWTVLSAQRRLCPLQTLLNEHMVAHGRTYHTTAIYVTNALMARRFVAKLVSQTCHPSHLNSIVESSCVNCRAFGTAVRRNAWPARDRQQCIRRTATSLLGSLRRGDESSRFRSASTLSDLRNVAGLESLNDELAEALVKDRSAARVQLYHEMMCHIHGGVQRHRQPLPNGLVPRSVESSDLMYLSVRSERFFAAGTAPPCRASSLMT